MTTPNLIPRVPRPQSPDQEQVLRRALDLHAAIINALLLDGTLFQDGAQSYGLTNLFFAGNGVPADTLAYTGDYYLDLTTGILYRKDQ